MHWVLVASTLVVGTGVTLRVLGCDSAGTTARVTAPTVAVPLLVGTASAGAVDQVGTVACQLGIGDLVTFVLAALAVFHVVAGAIKATTAFNALGSTRADRQRRGRRAMIGALQVTAGAFFPAVVGAIFTVVLDFELGACIHLV
ncbi:Protein of unknown function [Halorientalis persicus]|uniref:Uncharacterized protein n=1 Tax=Halorientalis persicus TaxID=1367881 RepID=A0A1H8INW3_9EURY|nr:DUF1691 domain-containing protein [Halorientalis persicus]SEN69755.1 Protein of unknown function [Halorientalis persicus]